MNKAVIRTTWIDNLRSFLTVLVVAHHSSLAYTTFAKFDKTTYIKSTAPIVDSSRWIGMDIFENFNDIFFMSLMFLISGLFFYRGIKKKGRKIFLADRLIRLGLPFVIVVALIMPLAYYPSFYLAEQRTSFAAFIHDFIFHQHWPPGPPWFIWILLSFNLVAAFIPIHFYTSVHAVLMKLTTKTFRVSCILPSGLCPCLYTHQSECWSIYVDRHWSLCFSIEPNLSVFSLLPFWILPRCL